MATKTTEKKVEKIESLTPAQIELLDVWREKWIKIGLNCDPIDFPKAKEAAALAYELADLKAPKMYFVMRDPIEGAIAGTLLKELMEPGAGNEIASTLLIEAIWSACGKPKAYKSVSDIMDKDFSKRARAYLFAGRFGCSKGKGTVRWFETAIRLAEQLSHMPEAKQVGAAFKGIGSEAMDDNLYGKALESTNGLQFSDERIKFNTAAATYLLAKGLTKPSADDLVKLSTSIRDDAEKWHKQQQDDIRQQVDSEIYGSHDAGWLSFYDYFKEVCHLECCDKLTGLIELAKVCGWWTPYENLAILQNRHEKILLDDFNRLHGENEPAMYYSGTEWGVYAWHGVRVPKYVIMSPQDITIEDIKSEPNAEVKRIKIERYGFDRYLVTSGAKILDRDFVPIEVGGLPMPRALIIDSDSDKYLYGTDGSTTRSYFMRTVSEARTCKEAHQAICGLDESKCVAQS